MSSVQIDRTDGLSSSTAIKGPCRVATTANVALSGEQVIDGVEVIVGDRVLVKDQTDARENGIWVADTGPWRRAKDFSNNRDIRKGTRVWVTDGTARAETDFLVDNENPIVIGTTTLTFVAATGPIGDGAVGATQITDDPLGWDAIAKKLRIVSKDDFTLYVDPVNGVDDYGRGAIGAPFKTPQGAQDLGTSILTNGLVTIFLADGEYTESYRTALSMQRPALIHVDQIRAGRRSDAPGGILTASIVFKGESKAGVILKPGSASGLIRAIYVTAGVGSIGFQNMTIDCQTGTESGIVAHRPGVYVHVYDVDILGNGIATYGLLAESMGMMEAINVTVDNCAVGAQTIAGGKVQMGLTSDITNCTWGAIVTQSSWFSLSVGADCSSPILGRSGGFFDTTGTPSQRITVSGNLTLRSGASWVGAYVDLTGTLTSHQGSTIDSGEFGYSKQWTDYGAFVISPAAKSYVAPATESEVANPLVMLGPVYGLRPDADFVIKNSSGTIVAENMGNVTEAVPSNGYTIPITIRNPRGLNVHMISATSSRTGAVLDTVQKGRFAGTPIPDGATILLIGVSSSVEIVSGSSAILDGGSVTVGTGTGLRSIVQATWSATIGKWLAIRGDPNP